MAAELAPEGIVSESKFLRLDSLHELVKALIIESRPAEGAGLNCYYLSIIFSYEKSVESS